MDIDLPGDESTGLVGFGHSRGIDLLKASSGLGFVGKALLKVGNLDHNHLRAGSATSLGVSRSVAPLIEA